MEWDRITSNTGFQPIVHEQVHTELCSGLWEAKELTQRSTLKTEFNISQQRVTLPVIPPKDLENLGPAALHSHIYKFANGVGMPVAHLENRHWRANKSLTRLSS